MQLLHTLFCHCDAVSGIGRFLVSLTSRMKPLSLTVSVTVLKNGVSGVYFFRWVRGLADVRNEAADAGRPSQ